MAKGIHDLGNGLGFIYVSDVSGSVLIESIPNSKSGARKAKSIASSVAATAVNKRGIGSITVTGITGTGSITAITVDGVNQITGSISYTGATTVHQLHALIEAAINGFTPGSSPNMSASFVGTKVNVLAPLDEGSSLNGYSITISSTGNATFSTADIDGGSNNTEVYDDSFGLRFYLDADYGISDVTGFGSAVFGDKSNAIEITDYIIPKSMNSAVTTVEKNLVSGAITPTRKSSTTFINVVNEGFASTDDLDYISVEGFSDGDIITLKSKFNITGVYTNVTENGNIQKSLDRADIVLGNNSPNASVSAITLQLDGGIWKEISRSESLSIGSLVDVDITTTPPTSGQTLVWNAGQDKFVPATIESEGAGSIDTLLDVDTSTVEPEIGDVLEWDGVNWVPAAGGGGGGANLSISSNTTTQVVIASDSGTDATLDSATGSLAGLMSAGDKTKLDLFTITGSANIDNIIDDVADLTTLTGVASNAEDLGTFTGTIIPDNSDIKEALQSLETNIQTGISIFQLSDVTGTVASGDLLSWDGTDFATVSKSEAGLAQIATPLALRYIPRVTTTGDGYGLTESLIYSGVSTLGFFGTTTTSYSFGMEGNSARSIGMERHSIADTVGNNLSIYAGGATSGASNKNGGSVDIYGGISTGTGTSSINFYTTPAGSSGSTDRTQTLKMSINGAGTTEITTSTANSKMRIGHNLRTILSLSTGIGMDLARVADGSYTIGGGIYMVDNATYRMLITSANAGVGFVRNHQTDTVAGTVIGGSSANGGANIWCGVGASGSYNFHFRRTWDNAGSAISAYIDVTGTNSNAAQSTGGLYINNNIVNSSTGKNYGLEISCTGHSTTASNIALTVHNGRVSILPASINEDQSYDVSFGSGANRTFGVNRTTTVATAGRSLTIYGGSAVSGGANLNGGNVTIVTGISTGTGGADIVFQTATPGSTGTTDRTPTSKVIIKGSGSVGIGTETPDAGAILDITSETKALILPRLTGDAAAALTGVNGMLIYVTSTVGSFTSVGFWGYEGGSWKKVTLV